MSYGEEQPIKPNHYKLENGMEVIDIIKLAVENENKQFNSFLIGNIIKYLFRFRKKNGLEDLKKAQNYLERLIKEVEKE